MKFNSLFKILLFSILFLFLIGCYTKIKYTPPEDNNEEEFIRNRRLQGSILSFAGISVVDSLDHIIYSVYSYSDFGRSSRVWIIDFNGRRKFFYNKNGKSTLINDYYLSPEELDQIENIFEKFGFNQFPMVFPRSGHPLTIGGGALVGYREKPGGDLIVSKRDGDVKDDYSMQQVNSFFLKIDKLITGKNHD